MRGEQWFKVSKGWTVTFLGRVGQDAFAAALRVHGRSRPGVVEKSVYGGWYGASALAPRATRPVCVPRGPCCCGAGGAGGAGALGSGDRVPRRAVSVSVRSSYMCNGPLLAARLKWLAPLQSGAARQSATMTTGGPFCVSQRPLAALSSYPVHRNA